MKDYTCIVNRISFRLDGNPLYLHNYVPVIFFVNTEIKYSPHQYDLLLKSIYLHAKSFQNSLVCFYGRPIDFVNVLKTEYKNVILDYTDDPNNWGKTDKLFDNNFKTTYSNTLTIVDWNKHIDLLKDIFKNTRYPQMSSFKKIATSLFEERIREHNHTKSKPISPKNKLNGSNWLSYDDLKDKITEHNKYMIDSKLVIFDFPNINGPKLNIQVENRFKKSISYMSSKNWYKPDTCANATLISNENEKQRTSKCSFLFSLGLLCPLYAYLKWGGKQTTPDKSKMGSATDQLLWREFFHGCSILPGFWNCSIGKKCFWDNGHKWTKENSKKLSDWKLGLTGLKDLDEAMVSLKNNGWIHHLQRHVVADYLTRGGLNYDWRMGEKWFKETLIDHDASVNRANWMWLSAVAFSSKQKIMHYNHSNYITRHCKTQKMVLNSRIKKSKSGGKNTVLKHINNGIFIFTRDLRIEDNRALYELSKKCDNIYAIFVFTPEQVKNNSYKSERAVRFMIECINELSSHIKLNTFEGSHVDILRKITKNNKTIKYIGISEDYTPYSKKRENAIKKWCEDTNKTFLKITNHCLCEPHGILTVSDTPYKVFTPYYNAVKKLRDDNIIPTVNPNKFRKLRFKSIEPKAMSKFYNCKNNSILTGGRSFGLDKLKNLKFHTDYNVDRNRIDKESTRLSAYLKFGVIGIRETFNDIKDHLGHKSEHLIRELHFRDFYMYISFYFPHVFGENFNRKLNTNKIWNNDKKHIALWKAGQTGVPLVDAAMRELNETGFMHNRGRMVVAMFFVKNLLCDWRIGEKYFANNLIDYDPCSNNGGWQWCASTGADGSQYTRVMNPFSQFIKIDPNGTYSREHVPEIKDIETKILTKWDEICKNNNTNYICPIVDVKESRKKAIEIFSKSF